MKKHRKRRLMAYLLSGALALSTLLSGVGGTISAYAYENGYNSETGKWYYNDLEFESEEAYNEYLNSLTDSVAETENENTEVNTSYSSTTTGGPDSSSDSSAGGSGSVDDTSKGGTGSSVQENTGPAAAGTTDNSPGAATSSDVYSSVVNSSDDSGIAVVSADDGIASVDEDSSGNGDSTEGGKPDTEGETAPTDTTPGSDANEPEVPNDEESTAPEDAGSTEPDDAGTTEPDDAGTTKPADAGTTKPADAGTTKPADAGTTKPADAGTTKPADAGTTAPSTTPPPRPPYRPAPPQPPVKNTGNGTTLALVDTSALDELFANGAAYVVTGDGDVYFHSISPEGWAYYIWEDGVVAAAFAIVDEDNNALQISNISLLNVGDKTYLNLTETTGTAYVVAASTLTKTLIRDRYGIDGVAINGEVLETFP